MTRSSSLGRYGLFWRLGNRLPGWPGIWVFNAGTLGNWVKQQRVSQEGNGPLGEDGLAELVRLRKEVAELRTGA